MADTKTGWLVKEGGSNKTWHRRFVVLDNRNLSYYSKEDKKKLKGVISVADMQSSQFVGDYGKHKYVFEIVTPDRVYHMKGVTREDSQEWSDIVKSIIDKRTGGGGHNNNINNGVANTTSNTTTATTNGGHHESDAPTVKVGIDDFQKLKVVGKGAFGKVYLVKKKDTGQVFAMKMLNKRDIKERDEVTHTLSEKSVLSKVEHPFLARLYYSFQSDACLFFIMDFINGGEVFHHLSLEGSFSEERTRFYAAEITLGLEYLHKNGVIYRDLKPENLLLNYQGHVIITDFGLSKEGLNDPSSTTKTFCGTPEYLAPEIIKGEEYSKAVDWWSLGTLIFEMINGLPPFYVNDNPELMYEKILYAPLSIPDTFSAEARDLISRFLDRDPNTRLQNPDEIKQHPFFRGLDWQMLADKQITPPFIPDVQSPEDVGNIDQEFLDESIGSDEERPSGGKKVQKATDFEGFTYQKS